MEDEGRGEVGVEAVVDLKRQVAPPQGWSYHGERVPGHIEVSLREIEARKLHGNLRGGGCALQ